MEPGPRTPEPQKPEEPGPPGEVISSEYGVVCPRVFETCPACVCPARFCSEALKGDLSNKDRKDVALAHIEFTCNRPDYLVILGAEVDSCVKCGVLYTVSRKKTVIPRSKLEVARQIPPKIILRWPGQDN